MYKIIIDGEEWLYPEDAKRISGVTLSMLNYLAREGEIRKLPNKGVLFAKKDVEQYARKKPEERKRDPQTGRYV